jgi:SAM-dependent methyltransferase
MYTNELQREGIQLIQSSRPPERLQQIREAVRKRSPFPPDKTEEILRQHFARMRAVVPYLCEQYSFATLKVLEIGSTYGPHLLFWGAGSEGIEVQAERATFTTSLGFPAHRLNIEDGFGHLKAGSFDAIHTNNLIEHLIAPHLFLARCYRLLRMGGILAIGHPVVPPRASRWFWRMLHREGSLATEHINFFTPTTIKLTLERAGFEVVEQFTPGFLRIHPSLARLILPLGPSCYSIARKKAEYRYPAKREALFDPALFRDDLKVFR